MGRALCCLGWSCTSGAMNPHRSLTNSQGLWKQMDTIQIGRIKPVYFFNFPKNYEEWCFLEWQVGAQLERRCCSFKDHSVCVLMPTQQKVSSHNNEKSHWHCCLSFALASWLIIQRFWAENNSFLLQVKVKEQILNTNVSYKIDFILVNLRINKSYL